MVAGCADCAGKRIGVPVEYLADAAVRHLKLPADLARPHAVDRHLQDLNAKRVRQGAPVCKHATVLVDVLTSCNVTHTHEPSKTAERRQLLTDLVTFCHVSGSPDPRPLASYDQGFI